MMLKREQDGVSIQSGDTGSISIRINRVPQQGEEKPEELTRVLREVCGSDAEAREDIESATPAGIVVARDRFPRFGFFAIALALVASAFLAELDFLRG